jgi:type II secretory pathway predicted ATPase ExeA/tetratricopeptide (TPR) repeat protein
MYLSYYNLSANPFQISTDPHFLWLGNDHKEALANLKFGVLENNGYAVLIGDVGTGKTTLINALVQALDKSVITAVINHPSMDAAEFFFMVVKALDPGAVISGKADCLHHLGEFLRLRRAEGRPVLLVIDESHRMSEMLLEEIRLLSNMEQDGDKLINIIFVGQPELKRKLQSSYCRALRQRITLYYHLQPLSKEDTRPYIAHRLRMSGAGANLFTPKSVDAIYKFSKGYPRLINKICDRALLTGFVKEKKRIDVSIIRECVREISLIDPMMNAIAIFQRFKRIPSAVRTLLKKTAVTAKTTSHEHEQAAGDVNQRPRRKVSYAVAAAAVLLVAGWIYTGVSNQSDSTSAQRAETLKEDAPAGYFPDAPAAVEERPLGSSEQVASLPSSMQGAPAQPPSLPTLPEIAAAMIADNDFQALIALLEARNGLQESESASLYARALVGRAVQLRDRSPKEAEALLRRAALADSGNVEALVQLGNLLTRAKNYSGALDAYQGALRLNPQHTDVLFNLGFIMASTGMYESAEEMLTRVVRMKPDYVDKALFNLAVVQQKIGKRKESLASLEAAVAIRPENESARAYLNELRSSAKDR